MQKIRFIFILWAWIFLTNLIHADPQKAVLCLACHGQKGLSPKPEWPNLAGQNQAYLEKQLKDFKQGIHRRAETMSAIITTLNDEDIRELAKFYSQQKLAENTSPEKYQKRGETLYRQGDPTKHITACLACHGLNGKGNAQAGFPILSGQNAPYTILQLETFKTKTRSNDNSGIMHNICRQMDKEDMEAVAYYIQGLH